MFLQKGKTHFVNLFSVFQFDYCINIQNDSVYNLELGTYILNLTNKIQKSNTGCDCDSNKNDIMQVYLKSDIIHISSLGIIN